MSDDGRDVKKTDGAIRLLKRWLADESGYDERVWPIAKKAIEENRLSSRSRFSDEESEREAG